MDPWGILKKNSSRVLRRGTDFDSLFSFPSVKKIRNSMNYDIIHKCLVLKLTNNGQNDQLSNLYQAFSAT